MSRDSEMVAAVAAIRRAATPVDDTPTTPRLPHAFTDMANGIGGAPVPALTPLGALRFRHAQTHGDAQTMAQILTPQPRH